MGVTTFNMLPADYPVSELGVCHELEGFYLNLQSKHVSTLLEDNKPSIDKLYNKAFDVFVYELDPMRVVFLQSEVDELKKSNFINQWLNIKPQQTCYSFYKAIAKFNKAMVRLRKLTSEIKDTELEIIAKTDKSLKIFIKKHKDKNNWAKNTNSLKENIMWAILTGYKDIKKYTETKKEALIVAKRVFKRQIKVNELNNLEKTKSEISKSVLYVLDAHSQFYSGDEFKEVIQSLTSSFVGVGIVVTEVGVGFKVVELVEGGPAKTQNKLNVGDVIVEVNGINIMGARRPLLARLLSGPQGTPVFLKVLDSNKTSRQVSIVREYVKTKQAEIKSELISYRGQKMGYIKLNHFYTGNSGSPGVSGEVVSLLRKFKARNLEGLIIDIRGNGGGVLSEVVKIAGLFLTSAPITIEVGTVGNGVQIHADRDGVSLFDGPLVILVDELSASASEILAGSLKTFNRAVIVGSQQTYGKGTIQEIGTVESVLNKRIQIKGAMKLTVGFYYLPDGSSVQFDGVKSHLVLPELKTQTKRLLEKALPFALKKPDKIDFEYDANYKWMRDVRFKDMVQYLKAQMRVRNVLPVDLNGKTKVAKIKNKAYNILSDIIEYSSGPLRSSIATRFEK